MTEINTYTPRLYSIRFSLVLFKGFQFRDDFPNIVVVVYVLLCNLNEKIIPMPHPLPNINDILDQLGKAKYCTVMDCVSVFHQIAIHQIIRIKMPFLRQTVTTNFLGWLLD